MKKIISIVFCLTLLLNTTVLAGLDSKKAAYLGGSTKDKDFTGAKGDVVGNLDTSNEQILNFEYTLNKEKKIYSIPYSQIIDIEYGQKAGRRVGAAIGSALLLGPVGLFLLFSKKRKHYVTIGYKDAAEKEQVAIFELGKDIVRTTLPVLEARSDKKITYQDEEAKKSGKGN